ncbi:hypothetical protein MMC27_006896 [Xylographa pallens]|nr:hypothetical protein [Xylographa pallens]
MKTRIEQKASQLAIADGKGGDSWADFKTDARKSIFLEDLEDEIEQRATDLALFAGGDAEDWEEYREEAKKRISQIKMNAADPDARMEKGKVIMRSTDDEAAKHRTQGDPVF